MQGHGEGSGGTGGAGRPVETARDVREPVAIHGRDTAEIQRNASRFGLRLSPAEWVQVGERLGRDPTLTEAFLFDVGWSEHCSYKSSRPLLKEYLPALSAEVVLGPGEDAGLVSLGNWRGEEWCLIVAHESHNHPSQVLPVEGAATGIGGIVRDVYCMGGDVIGVLDGLRFGDPDGPNAARVRSIARGVIQGISEYGNALGVPNLGGDVVFHPGFDDNCLVNVVAVGIVPRRRIVRSRVPAEAHSVPYVIVLAGKPTDDTGLGGASFASQILDEAEAGGNRGAVQIHDPFLKRVLADASRDALEWIFREGIPVGCKDLGAGGLGGASSELALAGRFGAEIDLSRVPQGLPGLAPHQVLCAETQERYVWAIPEARAAEFCAFFNDAYELGRVYPRAGATIIGRVIEERVYRCLWHGVQVAEIPNEVLETPPVLNRPRQARPGRDGSAAADGNAPAGGARRSALATPRAARHSEGAKEPAIKGAGAPVMTGGSEPADSRAWTEWVGRRLGSWNTASRAPVYRWYDQEVRGEAFLRPGEAGAGVCRPLDGERLGIAVSLDGHPVYGALDPYWAGALAVLEAARNVAATGARPLVLTDCLNFGNPEDPVCLGDFEEALRGMRDACVAVGSAEDPAQPLSIISGNVSFYNQSASGRAIAPSPLVCCYGLLRDYTRAATPRLKAEADRLLLVGAREPVWGEAPEGREPAVPRPDLARESRVLRVLPQLIEEGLIAAAQDIGDGGLLLAAWEMMTGDERPGDLGMRLDLSAIAALEAPAETATGLLCSEAPGFLLEVRPARAAEVAARLRTTGVAVADIGEVTAGPSLRIERDGTILGDVPAAEVYTAWAGKLESITHIAEGR